MKFNIHIIILNFLIFANSIPFSICDLPEGFVYINDIDKSIKVNLKYYGSDNYLGRRVPHYKANKGILTKEAAIALNKAQKIFLSKGYSIVVYDAYRPDSSVKYFIEWMNEPNDIIRKKYHYPHVEEKKNMMDIYISSRSGHSHGNTVDISLIKINKELLIESVYEERVFNGTIYPFNNDNTIDCGTSFDLMDNASWVNSSLNFTDEQKNNRNLIREVMEDVGFKILTEEWWHFTLKDGPYNDIYFDFEIE